MSPFDVRLTGRVEIAEAVKRGAPVFADCQNLPARLPVREVKVSQGILHVRLLEGWRVPACVYLSDTPSGRERDAES